MSSDPSERVARPSTSGEAVDPAQTRQPVDSDYEGSSRSGSMRKADTANGEGGTSHPTGDERAQENAENDPPA